VRSGVYSPRVRTASPAITSSRRQPVEKLNKASVVGVLDLAIGAAYAVSPSIPRSWRAHARSFARDCDDGKDGDKRQLRSGEEESERCGHRPKVRANIDDVSDQEQKKPPAL
jgi:hypothetical protein